MTRHANTWLTASQMGGVADVFVEDPPTEIEEANVSDFEDELVDMDDGAAGTDDEDVASDNGGGASENNEEVSKKHLVYVTKQREPREKIEMEISMLREFYRSPVKKGNEICLLSHEKRSGKRDAQEGLKNDGSPSSEDSDYVIGDACSSACSSEEDEQAHEILKRFRNFKKKWSGGVASLDDVELTNNGPKAAQTELQSEGCDTLYADSDDEYSVEQIGSDGELRRKKQHYKRFSCSDEVPKFELGMKFSGKKEFKEAIIQYCLNERNVVKYVKDEPIRVRAACDWRHCPWV